MPISVKDILDVAGLPTRWGSPLMADAKPAAADIAAVARLRARGAVIIGKTTTTEFAHSLLGASPLTGVTRNPWAPEFTCGGSSAGGRRCGSRPHADRIGDRRRMLDAAFRRLHRRLRAQADARAHAA